MGYIITFSGRPGSGKSTLVKALLEARPDLKMFPGKSFITREARADDVPEEYEYVTTEMFEEMRRDGKFAWTFPHPPYQVGTRYNDLTAASRATYSSIMVLVPDAVVRLMRLVKDSQVIPFFLEAPEEQVLMRLASRPDAEVALERFENTPHWTFSRMLEMGVHPILISTANEDPPTKTSLPYVLNIFQSFGI